MGRAFDANRPLYICADNAKEADNYRRSIGLMRHEARYVATPDSLRGLVNPSYVIIGSFYDRRDAREIVDVLEAAKMKAKVPEQ